MDDVAKKHRFTVEEYHRMAEAGILEEDDRVELIEGEVVAMAPIGSRHAACVERTARLFADLIFGGRLTGLMVRTQNPIALGPNAEPEPDVALVGERGDFYSASHPAPEDVALVVEVADASLEYDRDRKLPAYARAGVPEVWIVDLSGGMVEVFTEPSARGYRRSAKAFGREPVVSAALAGASVGVDEVLGTTREPE